MNIWGYIRVIRGPFSILYFLFSARGVRFARRALLGPDSHGFFESSHLPGGHFQEGDL